MPPTRVLIMQKLLREELKLQLKELFLHRREPLKVPRLLIRLD